MVCLTEISPLYLLMIQIRMNITPSLSLSFKLAGRPKESILDPPRKVGIFKSETFSSSALDSSQRITPNPPTLELQLP
jgi:hypothetical protein